MLDGFMCAHVRRGNFKKACERYDSEYHSDTSRPWVKSFAETGETIYDIYIYMYIYIYNIILNI